MPQRLRATLVVAALACSVLLGACLPPGSPDGDGRTRAPSGPIELDGVEVQEYEGQDLSSVDDFRENSIKGPQVVEKEGYRLAITGMVSEPLSLTYDEVIDRQTYEKVVTLNCVEGWSVTILWEGVMLRELLDLAEVDSEANTVIFRAVDGYSTSLPLQYFYDNDIILAHRMNGVTLPPERGFPFELVAEEKWGYKWIKWVEEVELSDDESYRGYWESRGYSNEAEAGGAIFGD